MVDTGYTVFLCDTVTGRFTRSVPVSKVGWGSRLNTGGPVTATIPVAAVETSSLQLREATALVRQSLGVAYNGIILECGPIWSRAYDPKAETLDLTASGLWSIFDRRKALPGAALAGLTPSSPGAVNPAAQTLTITGKSLGSIGRELVRASLQDSPWIRPDGTNGGALNIILPADVPGTHDRTYYGYDLGWIGTRLTELTAVDNGPDMRFRPRFNGTDPTIVEWVYETGSEAAPLLAQTGPDWQWDGSVPGSPVVGFGKTEDATGLAARAWAPGSGQGVAMQMGWATDLTLVNDGWPWTEADAAAKSEPDPTVLQSYAVRQLADASAPWEQWSLQVRVDAAPLLGSYLPGEWAQVTVPEGHPMIDPGAYRVRIIAVDGDNTMTVKLTVAPMQSVNGGGTGTGGKVLAAAATPTLYPSPTLHPSPTLYPSGG